MFEFRCPIAQRKRTGAGTRAAKGSGLFPRCPAPQRGLGERRMLEGSNLTRLELKGLKSFDKILYINMDDRPERRAMIEGILHEYGITDAIRIPAVSQPHNGHLGCAQSHIKALKKAKKMGLENVLIVEDDFQFKHDVATTNQVINKALSAMGDDWDGVHIGISYTIPHPENTVNSDVVRRVKSAMSSSMYAVQSHFYDKLIANLEEAEALLKVESKTFPDHVFCSPVALDQHWGKLQEASKWYAIDPTIGAQNMSSGSSIMDFDGQDWNYHPSCKDWPNRVVELPAVNDLLD